MTLSKVAFELMKIDFSKAKKMKRKERLYSKYTTNKHFDQNRSQFWFINDAYFVQLYNILTIGMNYVVLYSLVHSVTEQKQIFKEFILSSNFDSIFIK
jgi:hypothetical protein